MKRVKRNPKTPTRELHLCREFAHMRIQFPCLLCREESKGGSDLDEPWIMTVKGVPGHTSE